MCKNAAVKSVKQKTRETEEEEAEEVYVTQINLELTSESKKNGRLTQKIKLKKNNIYLMHFVQPVTAMFPGLVSSSLRPNQTSCESERSRGVYFPGSHSRCRGEGGSVCSASWAGRTHTANSSFIIKSENRDGRTAHQVKWTGGGRVNNKLPIYPSEQVKNPMIS